MNAPDPANEPQTSFPLGISNGCGDGFSATPAEQAETTSEMLLRLVSKDGVDIIERPITFVDYAETESYLKNLRRFKEESAKVSILIG